MYYETTKPKKEINTDYIISEIHFKYNIKVKMFNITIKNEYFK